MHVIYRQVEHAWLDLGLLDKTRLIQMQKDLSNASKKVVVKLHPNLCSLGIALGAFGSLVTFTFTSAQADAEKRFLKLCTSLGEH